MLRRPARKPAGGVTVARALVQPQAPQVPEPSQLVHDSAVYEYRYEREIGGSCGQLERITEMATEANRHHRRKSGEGSEGQGKPETGQPHLICQRQAPPAVAGKTADSFCRVDGLARRATAASPRPPRARSAAGRSCRVGRRRQGTGTEPRAAPLWALRMGMSLLQRKAPGVGETTPEGRRPWLIWKRCTAARVSGPNRPSTGPQSYPSLRSIRCTSRTGSEPPLRQPAPSPTSAAVPLEAP